MATDEMYNLLVDALARTQNDIKLLQEENYSRYKEISEQIDSLAKLLHERIDIVVKRTEWQTDQLDQQSKHGQSVASQLTDIYKLYWPARQILQSLEQLWESARLPHDHTADEIR